MGQVHSKNLIKLINNLKTIKLDVKLHDGLNDSFSRSYVGWNILMFFIAISFLSFFFLYVQDETDKTVDSSCLRKNCKCLKLHYRGNYSLKIYP